jgi:hypothetical protein
MGVPSNPAPQARQLGVRSGDQMYRLRIHIFILGLVFLTTTPIHAQRGESHGRNEIGLVIGAMETPGIDKTAAGTIDLNSSIALGAEYDRLLLGINVRPLPWRGLFRITCGRESQLSSLCRES